jgi:hypothetical protein
VPSSSSRCHPRSKPSPELEIDEARRSAAARRRPLTAARACARPGPLDGDPTARVGLDPGPCGSTRIAAPASRCHRRIVIQRIRSVPRRSNPLDLGGFAKKTPHFFRFTTRSFHRYSFLADRSYFLRFSPKSLGFFSV